ncbi:MAG TPA: hypothetical protein VGG74_05855 [Kofleriaceae bacterium]
MTDAFHMGGWGMYPTLIAGLVLVATAIGFAISPDARRRLLVRALASLTLLVGTLGFVSGVIKTFTSCAPTFQIALEGIGESLANIGLALVMLVMAGIATAIGVGRRGGEPPDHLHGI